MSDQFSLVCKNLLTLIWNTHFINGFCTTEKIILGVSKKGMQEISISRQNIRTTPQFQVHHRISKSDIIYAQTFWNSNISVKILLQFFNTKFKTVSVIKRDEGRNKHSICVQPKNFLWFDGMRNKSWWQHRGILWNLF